MVALEVVFMTTFNPTSDDKFGIRMIQFSVSSLVFHISSYLQQIYDKMLNSWSTMKFLCILDDITDQENAIQRSVAPQHTKKNNNKMCLIVK